MRRRLGAVVGALVTIVAASWLVVVIATDASDADQRPATTPISDPANVAAPGPNRLTDHEREEAASIALGAEVVRSHVGDQVPTVTRVLSWSDDTGVILGAAVELGLAVPVHLEAGLPRVKPGAPYGRDVTDFTADGVTRLLVVVDLATRQVVGLQPGPGARITRLAGVAVDQDQD